MKVFHLVVLVTFSLSVITIVSYNCSYASDLAIKYRTKLDETLVENVENMQPTDKLVVWIDINAARDSEGCFRLPADPANYGIKYGIVSQAPDIEKSKLFWCLVEIEKSDVERIAQIPWVMNLSFVRAGSFDNIKITNTKLSQGLAEIIERANEYGGVLPVIVWMQPSVSFNESYVDREEIPEYAVENVTVAIRQFEGRIYLDYYKGCKSIAAIIPVKYITLIAENPYVKKILIDGPGGIEEMSESSSFSGFNNSGKIVCALVLSQLAIWSPLLCATVVRRKKQIRKLLLILILISSCSLFSFGVLPVRGLNVSTSAINADTVWSSYGNKGQGVNIAILENGFDDQHPDLVPAIIRKINMMDMSDDVRGDWDQTVHGTRVAGIIAGRGIGNGAYKGVAPEAGLILVKIPAGDAYYERAIQWVIDNRVQYNIAILNMCTRQIGFNPGGDGLESPASIQLDDAVENGIVVVKSAGNLGPGAKTITPPGNGFNTITVGCVYDNDTPDIADDILVESSSRGPTADGRPKPDVVAPGWKITSCTANGGYDEDNGTSFAAPHVAGTVALMLHANPNLTPAQVKAILRQTARLNTNLNGYGVNDRGHGIIDAYAAVQMAQNVASIDRNQMYDSFDVAMPSRDLGWGYRDYLSFSVRPPADQGVRMENVNYHKYFDFLGIPIPVQDYKLLQQEFSRDIWIDGVHYDLGVDMHKYLFTGPRIYDKTEGHVAIRVLYRINGVFVRLLWSIGVDQMDFQVCCFGGSSWKTLMYLDPEIWKPENYPFMNSTGETILIERKLQGDQPFEIRDITYPGEYLQIDPCTLVQGNYVTWVLKHGYFGSNPDDPAAKNNEYICKRDVVVYYQGDSFLTWMTLRRGTEQLGEPNFAQNDAGSGRDAGDFGGFFRETSTPINKIGCYDAILCDPDSDPADPTDRHDIYNFQAEAGQEIAIAMTPPPGIDFDIELYAQEGMDPKAKSQNGAGQTDNILYVADSTGLWYLHVTMVSEQHEAQYHFDVYVGWDPSFEQRCTGVPGVYGNPYWYRSGGWRNVRGDLDHDGDCDGFDLSIFTSIYGHEYNNTADFDGDGDVDGVDLSHFLQSYRYDVPMRVDGVYSWYAKGTSTDFYMWQWLDTDAVQALAGKSINFSFAFRPKSVAPDGSINNVRAEIYYEYAYGSNTHYGNWLLPTSDTWYTVNAVVNLPSNITAVKVVIHGKPDFQAWIDKAVLTIV